MISLPNEGFKLCTKTFVINKMKEYSYNLLDYYVVCLERYDVICAYSCDMIVFLSADLKYRYILRLETYGTSEIRYTYQICSKIDARCSYHFFQRCLNGEVNINDYKILCSDKDNVIIKLRSFDSIIFRLMVLKELLIYDMCRAIIKLCNCVIAYDHYYDIFSQLVSKDVRRFNNIFL